MRRWRRGGGWRGGGEGQKRREERVSGGRAGVHLLYIRDIGLIIQLGLLVHQLEILLVEFFSISVDLGPAVAVVLIGFGFHHFLDALQAMEGVK